MSAPAASTFGERLPSWLRPREREQGTERTRLIESTLMVLVAIVLAVATIDDVVLQTRVNHRIVADLRTWREYTGHDYKNVAVEQDFYGHTTRDIVCGNVSPGPPGARTQICVLMTGPVRAGRRAARGGYYLPAMATDRRSVRFGCYGSAESAALCGG